MVQADENSNGNQVDLPAGETLEVCLSENRTTGYKWTLESSGDVCALLNDTFQPSQGTGEPGNHCWRFRAERVGSGSIELSYRRAWGEDKAPARTFKLTVQVS
jgi:inhibitor of cysteine peptidase